MWSLSKYILFCLFIIPASIIGQECTITLSGYVKDSGVDEPLEAVSIYLQESDQGVITDEMGKFEITSICQGKYHLIASHIGCETKSIFIDLQRDTHINLSIDHTITTLNQVELIAQHPLLKQKSVEMLSKVRINQNAEKSLATMLEEVIGVSSIKNGQGISKPVVNGMYGNRLTIVNNGITQSGQQWGNDHGPEIDPLAAQSLRVIKNVSALEYMGSNLGNVVIIDSENIEAEEHLHGNAMYLFESNGLGNGIHLNLKQKNRYFSWRVNGTLKKVGDRKTADYFLNNTGNEEANVSLQLEHQYGDKLFSEVYFSTFNTKLGVLRGSHIGNLTDLEEALQRDVPFFTDEDFSYNIEAPYQRVHHHLVKFNHKYFINPNHSFEFNLGAQLNQRQEYDIRRSNRSEKPALSLNQKSYILEAKSKNHWAGKWALYSGIQFNLIDNENIPETDILPLIPDYFQYQLGAYSIGSQEFEKFRLELGLRYDIIWQNVVRITSTVPRQIVRSSEQFNNIGSSFSWSYHPNSEFSILHSIGFASRVPAINELYSQGLHQGVSGIEEGNLNLSTEKSLKTLVELKRSFSRVVDVDIVAYYQYIRDYIYLKPAEEFRLTIRGAFPVFTYTQTNAQIYGTDISTRIHFSKSIRSTLSYSYLKGHDLAQDIPLINMPSNSLAFNLNYAHAKPIDIFFTQLENFEVFGDYKYYFKQDYLLANQDFVEAPDSYHLVAIGLSTEIPSKRFRWRLTARVENLFNASYRNYLNRTRYFADDQGRNIVIIANLRF